MEVIRRTPFYYWILHMVIVSLFTGYSLEQSEALVSLMSESLHMSLKPVWASIITKTDAVCYS